MSWILSFFLFGLPAALLGGGIAFYGTPEDKSGKPLHVLTLVGYIPLAAMLWFINSEKDGFTRSEFEALAGAVIIAPLTAIASYWFSKKFLVGRIQG